MPAIICSMVGETVAECISFRRRYGHVRRGCNVHGVRVGSMVIILEVGFRNLDVGGRGLPARGALLSVRQRIGVGGNGLGMA